MAQGNKQNLLYLFDRPAQPIFRPKGPDSTVNFELPPSYYTDRYRPIATQVLVRGPADTIIPVQEYPTPDISLAMTLDKRTNFSNFNPFHTQCATNLINTLMGMRTLDEFMSACCYIQQRVNPYLYIYALSVAILHRPDTRDVPIPSHVCTFPELYVDSVTLARAREEGTVLQDSENRIAVEIPRNFTASDLELEQRVAYFREDIGVNLHHWHWHLVYPNDGPDNVVRKDRRGELFYYMHQQIIARYESERLSNNLPRVTQFSNLRERFPDAYFPKLDSLISSRVWPPRYRNTLLSNLNREADQIQVDIQDLERWRDRIFEAIHRGSVQRGSETLQLTETEGIDLLGNILEASVLSVNRNLYGNLHNMGHNVISFSHDPDGRYLETFGVMGDSTTAMRDPIFYRWHKFINDIFEEHKHTLPPYTTQQLSFDGIRVNGIEVRIPTASTSNSLQTFWQRSQVDLSRGLDFAPRGPVYAAFTHLQHAPFMFRMNVENSGAQRMGTVRIFIAPRLDERGTPFLLRDQKRLFIELDRFITTLTPGTNTITRQSRESSVTIPFEQTFRSLENRPADGTEEQEAFNFCGCGWPEHMLIPKGTTEGLAFDLFVIITDYQQDIVEGATLPSNVECDNAFSFCGVRNSRFPDRKPMGFPFDRMPRTGVNTLRQFLTPNMATQEIRVVHQNRTVAGPGTGISTSAATTQPQTSGGGAGRPTGTTTGRGTGRPTGTSSRPQGQGARPQQAGGARGRG